MSPDLVQAISGLGALGFAVIAVWAFGTGRVRVGSLVDKDIAQIRGERDAALRFNEAVVAKLDRMGDAVEALTKAVERLDAARTAAVSDAVQAIVAKVRDQ